MTVEECEANLREKPLIKTANFGTTEQHAEKCGICGRMDEKHPSGAKAPLI
jgi:hypothetical protein